MADRRLSIVRVAVLALAFCTAARADETPAATIKVTSATAGSSLGGKLVEGVLHYRDRNYLLTLDGVAKSVTTQGSVYGLQRMRDIAGTFRPAGNALRNASGVVIRFDPPLPLEGDRLEIQISGGFQPKVSRGHPEAGVE